jgi:hypothetical protein|tara:strand:- start:133 stop:327 length:195 start_codon:yes stop_codon:yes gene_type:complete
MQLSEQAAGALMMVLQKCLWEQVDIMGLLNDMVFEMSDDGLVVTNPPVVSGDLDDLREAENAED